MTDNGLRMGRDCEDGLKDLNDRLKGMEQIYRQKSEKKFSKLIRSRLKIRKIFTNKFVPREKIESII